MRILEDYVEDFGIEYILEALDIRPAYVVEYLLERGVIDKEELDELLNITVGDEDDEYEFNIWD